MRGSADELMRGMGLADIESRVRALGGTAVCGPYEDGWACVRIRAEEALDHGIEGLMRIAIVDDDPIVCQSLETILTATGTAEVLWMANDGDAAVRRYFETPASRPDVLLIDIQMPGTSGLDAAREILATDPAARILFLTTFADQSYIAQAMGLGAKGYLIKQDVAAVGPALQAVMAGQVVLGAEVLGKLTERTPDPADSDDSRDTADSIEGLLGEREREITALVAEGSITATSPPDCS